MKIYLVIDRGQDIEPIVIHSTEELRVLTKIGNLKIYSANEIEKSIDKKVRILAYFGSEALREIKEGKAQYAELIISIQKSGRRKLLDRIRTLIKI